MSSKGRSAAGYKPDPNGFFETQPQVTRAILPFLGIKSGARILQPGCGTGAIAKVLRREYGASITIVGVEIDGARAKKARAAKVIHQASASQNWTKIPVYDLVVTGDFFSYQAQERFDLAIENPSFGIWLPVTERCFELADQTCMLIPWNSAASKGRVNWWLSHPAYNRVLSPRPSFARSVKCIYTNPRRVKSAQESGGDAQPCAFQELIALSDTPKDTCPLCGAATTTISSDSNEYCWAHWSPAVTHNRWDPLPLPDMHLDDA